MSLSLKPILLISPIELIAFLDLLWKEEVSNDLLLDQINKIHSSIISLFFMIIRYFKVDMVLHDFMWKTNSNIKKKPSEAPDKFY